MGRQPKAGLDYFELDCHMEEKVKLIQAEYGLKGFAVVVKLYQKIYGEFGYFCEWSEDSLLLFMSENGLSSDNKQLIQNIVSACIRRNIFSKQLYEKFGILTSNGIQKRYLNAVSRRNKVEMKKEYLLICVPENTDNVNINSIYVDINAKNVCRNTQSRVEKSRVEYNNIKKRKKNNEKEKITVSDETVCRTQSVQLVAEKWNELETHGIKPVSKLTTGSQRYQQLSARIREYGIDDVLKAIDLVKQSRFLLGDNNRGWSITFDWFVKPNNFPKVLEGNYSNREKHTQGYQSQSEQMLEHHYDMVSDWVRQKEMESAEE